MRKEEECDIQIHHINQGQEQEKGRIK